MKTIPYHAVSYSGLAILLEDYLFSNKRLDVMADVTTWDAYWAGVTQEQLQLHAQTVIRSAVDEMRTKLLSSTSSTTGQVTDHYGNLPFRKYGTKTKAANNNYPWAHALIDDKAFNNLLDFIYKNVTRIPATSWEETVEIPSSLLAAMKGLNFKYNRNARNAIEDYWIYVLIIIAVTSKHKPALYSPGKDNTRYGMFPGIRDLRVLTNWTHLIRHITYNVANFHQGKPRVLKKSGNKPNKPEGCYRNIDVPITNYFPHLSGLYTTLALGDILAKYGPSPAFEQVVNYWKANEGEQIAYVVDTGNSIELIPVGGSLLVDIARNCAAFKDGVAQCTIARRYGLDYDSADYAMCQRYFGDLLQAPTTAVLVSWLRYRGDFDAKVHDLFDLILRYVYPSMNVTQIDSVKELGSWINQQAYFEAATRSKNPDKVQEHKNGILAGFDSRIIGARTPEQLLEMIVTGTARLQGRDCPAEAHLFLKDVLAGTINLPQAKNLISLYSRVRA